RNAEDRLQVLHCVGVDLLELREAMALKVAVVEKPVLRLLGDVERTLLGHFGRTCRRQRGGRKQRARQSAGESQGLHGNSSRAPAGCSAHALLFIFCRAEMARMHVPSADAKRNLVSRGRATSIGAWLR